jgi:hypothetical protein
VNFYLLPEDYNKIQSYLQECEWQILATPLTSDKMVFIETLLKDEDHEKNNFYKRLLLLKHQVYLPKKLNDDIFVLNVVFDKLIEFHACKWDTENQILGRGRIFYETGFYDENGVWQEKDAEFLKAAEKLFRWFRKNFQKSDLTYGFYTSPAVLAWVKNGGVLKQV